LQLGPLRNIPGTAEVAGCLSGAGLVLILAVAMSIYGEAAFQGEDKIGVKTLTGRSLPKDRLKTAEG
jgi:photosystem I subunit 11